MVALQTFEASVADLGNDDDNSLLSPRETPTDIGQRGRSMEAFLVSVKERGIDILLHLVPTPYVICLMGELPLMLNDYVFRKEKGSLVAEN